MQRGHVLWTILILGATTAAVWAFRADRQEAPIPGEGTAKVRRTSIERSVVATGVLRPKVGAEIEVGSRVSGKVLRLPVAVGDVVEAGDLLVQLDSSALEATVDAAVADQRLAISELALASARLERSRRLQAVGITSREQLDVALRDHGVMEARLEAADARLRRAEIDLGYSHIVAPMGGVIAEVTTRAGETVAASFAAPTFVTIVDLERLEVQAFVDETDVGRIFPGQTASFSVETYADTNIQAVVSAIYPKAQLQNSVVNYVAILSFETPPGLILRPEMTAHVRFLLERRDEVLAIPRRALRRRDGRSFVRARRQDTWIEQQVTTGWRDEHLVEIRQGLEDGETVLLNDTSSFERRTP